MLERGLSSLEDKMGVGGFGDHFRVQPDTEEWGGGRKLRREAPVLPHPRCPSRFGPLAW